MNVDLKQKQKYVDRMVEIEQRFQDAKAEHDEDVKDLKLEIKSRYDETGVDPKEVVRLSKIRLHEQESRENAALLEADLATYDVMYGKDSKSKDDDPLA